MHNFRPAVFNFYRLSCVVGGEDDGRNEARHFIGDGGEIDFHQFLPCRYPLAFFDQHGEAFTAQFDGVDADMDEDFQAVVGFQSYRVAGGKDGGDAAVCRGADDAVAAGWVNGEARAESVRGEGGVGDVAGGKYRALQRHLPFGRNGVGIRRGRGFFRRFGGRNRGRCYRREAFRVVAAAREGEGQAEGNGKGDHHPDDVRRQVLRADGDDAGDARCAEGDGFGFVEGDVGAGAGGADEGGVEGVAQTQIDAEHRRFGDAEHGGDAGGGGEAL